MVARDGTIRIVRPRPIIMPPCMPLPIMPLCICLPVMVPAFTTTSNVSALRALVQRMAAMHDEMACWWW